MIIWKLWADSDNYECLTFCDDEHWRLTDLFVGKSLIKDWNPVSIRVMGKRRKSDSPSLTPGVPVFSEKAVEVLKDILADKVEFLPINCTKGKYYLVNVTNVIDALDVEKSEFKRSSTGKIMGCTKHVFKQEELKDQYIFKIPQSYWATVFVNDEFKNRVIQEGLQGFMFIETWNSEL